jgi:hypothetical protein
MPEYDLEPDLDQIAQAIARVEAATNDAEWRAAALAAAPLLARGSAALMEALARPAPAIVNANGDEALRAQRFARVKVAEMQLYHAAQVRAGRDAGNLYAALQPQIDAARAEFRERFLTGAHSAPDYLHNEIVRSLANREVGILGPGYPGPLA